MGEQKIEITLMRHGRSRADDEHVYEGRYDSPLTEVGRAQAQYRAEMLAARKVTFDRIIASTLQRARDTASIIGKVLDVPLDTDPDWMEMNNGPLAGMFYTQADKEYPIPDFRNPYESFWETGESDWELYTRAARAVEKVIRRGPGKYLVVAHGGILSSALRTIVGAQPGVNRQGIIFVFGDTGFVRLVYYPKTHQWLFREFYAGE